jgi:plastocyanin
MSFGRTCSTLFVGVALACVTGCDDASSHGKADPSGTPRAAGPSAGGGRGTVRGTVTLVGEPPEMQEIANDACHAGATPIREETVVADERGRLANVVVFLREAPAVAAGSAPPRPAAVLDQANCRYVPHVLALRTGQVLRVTSSDPTVHNVHTLASANPAANVGMNAGAAPVEMTFDRPEEIAVRCDIHPWMSARLHVFDHDAFAVTGADGAFELTDVPAGQYTLVFRHELFGDVEETVEVADGQLLTKDAAYEKPGR